MVPIAPSASIGRSARRSRSGWVTRGPPHPPTPVVRQGGASTTRSPLDPPGPPGGGGAPGSGRDGLSFGAGRPGHAGRRGGGPAPLPLAEAPDDPPHHLVGGQ